MAVLKNGPRDPRLVQLFGHVAFVTLVVCTNIATPFARMSPEQVDELQVKAAFLYNFSKFIQWPPEASQGPIVIGVAGDETFGEQLSHTVKGRQIGGRDIVVRQLKTDDEARSCQIVFVSESATRRATAILSRVSGAAVLTVGESQAFIKDGGHIRFYVEQNRVRFQISSENAERAGLKISAQLMTLAKQQG